MGQDEDEEQETLDNNLDVDVETPTNASRCGRFLAFLRSNRFLIYTCCFISAWGERMWSFAIGIYMIALYPKSLELTAIYGFFNCGCSLIFGAIIGDFIDRTPRMKAVRIALILRNLSIFSCAAVVFVTFFTIKQLEGTWLFTVSKASIIFLAILARLAGIANNITVTKDWVVVVCNNKKALAEMSVTFRRIDLFCKLVAPVVVGQIMAFATNEVSAIFICCENIVTFIIMYAILRTVYKRVPRLAYKAGPAPTTDLDNNTVRRRRSKTLKWTRRLCMSCVSLYTGWRCYTKNSVCSAGISLAMMYMTVLAFDPITVGYAYSQGMRQSALSFVMSASAVTGIVGTFLFLPMRKRFGLLITGIISFGIDLIFLQLCVWSVFAPGTVFLHNPPSNGSVPLGDNITQSLNASAVPPGETSSVINVSIILLMVGIVFSRIGLWLVDLTVTQLILETVVEKERGKVNGVQYSMNMFMDLLKFLLVILIPQPRYFGFLIMLSFSFIVIGLIIFTVYAIRHRFIEPTPVSLATPEEEQQELEEKEEKEDEEKVEVEEEERRESATEIK